MENHLIQLIPYVAGAAVLFAIVKLFQNLQLKKELQETIELNRTNQAELKQHLQSFQSKYEELQKEFSSQMSDSKCLIQSLEDKLSKRNNEVRDLRECIEEKDKLYETLKSGEEGKIKIASLIADHETLQYEITAKYLRDKKTPAIPQATKVTELKQKTKQIYQELQQLKYQYESITALFPDTEKYIEEIQPIINGDEEEEDDPVDGYLKKLLSVEEYQNLTPIQKAERALALYIKGKKTNWQVGRDYEMSVGHALEQQGYKVEYTGIKHRLEDMGRDLIAHKNDETYIIQCKHWKKKIVIHEKHIAQIYGTAKQYEMENIVAKNQLHVQKVIPKIVTSTSISETARKFAKYLGVIVEENQPLVEFPRVKCNKKQMPDPTHQGIYHLPIDQQYDKVLNKGQANGDIWVSTVEEAEKLGFRRAFRYRNNNNSTTTN